MYYQSELQVREAAKAVLFSGSEILVVAGNSGRFNLPGGGIDEGETPKVALYRELYEELGLEHDHLRGIEEAGRVEGIVTTKSGGMLLAKWSIFVAEMLIPTQELILSDDITRIERASRSTILQRTAPYISDLALNTIRQTT